jgi:hypothetical protein
LRELRRRNGMKSEEGEEGLEKGDRAKRRRLRLKANEEVKGEI